jgi:hypothetical protein
MNAIGRPATLAGNDWLPTFMLPARGRCSKH